MKTKNIFNIIIIIGFCLIIFLVPILTKIEKPAEYSIYENRNLAEAPVFSFEKIFKNPEEDASSWDIALGKYMASWDIYYSDHIFQRDKFLQFKNSIDIDFLKRPVVNEVIIQKNLLLPFNTYNIDNSEYPKEADWYAYVMSNLLSDLVKLVESYGGKFIYIGVPEQYSMLREFYPEYLNNNDERLSMREHYFFTRLEEKNIDYINMRTEFNKTEDFIYYYSKTDHHYNLLGAFYSYQTLINKLNEKYNAKVPMLTDDDIEFVKLNNPFYGSRNRKLYNRYNLDDKLYYYINKKPVEFKRTDNGNKVTPFIFKLPDENDETTPVTYNIYMNGDIAETIIQTERENLPNALLFGDSFTNPFETFLYYSFNETRSLDMRHYKESTILEYIEKYKPDYVFCMRDDTAYFSFTGNGKIE